MKPSRTAQTNFSRRNSHSQPSTPKSASGLSLTKRVTKRIVVVLILFSLLVSLQRVLQLSILNGQVVVGGVPISILTTFLQDDTARNAYLNRDRQLLHNRLQTLGIEEEIKDFYRSQITDKVELDQYIHQIFYDRTGYVGVNYWVNSEGILVLKKGRLERIENDL